jgi:putative zinc finger/helix-turn-helix YgiT family protein
MMEVLLSRGQPMEIKTKVIEGLCTNCEEKTEQEIITKEQIINVKNEPIKVQAYYLKCKKCGDEVYDTTEKDPFNTAYRKYREIHGMLQPEQIKDLREKCGLSQAELAKVLGLGVATISRYENGALQDTAHDNLLKLAMDPFNFSQLLEKYKDLFSKKREKPFVAF